MERRPGSGVEFLKCLYNVSFKSAHRSQRGHGFQAAEVTGGCELPDTDADLNPGPLKEQEVLLTTEQSVQSTCIHFFKDRMST